MAESIVKLIVDATQGVRSLGRFKKATNEVEGAVLDANGRLEDAKGRLVGSGAAADKASLSFGNLSKKLVKVAAAYATLRTAQAAVSAGIQRVESERRIKFLAQSYGEVAKLTKAASDASERFGVSQTTANQALAQVFARLRPVGVSLEDIVSTYNGFNTAARISGATSVEASNAFTQLAQALGSGALRGDEFNSISEQVPGILTAISKESGVAQGQLRKFAAEGGITAEIVISALKRIETEGVDQLNAALGGPSQAIANFQNATEDVQVALTQEIIPQISEAFRGLAELILNLEPAIKFIGGLAAGTLNQINSLIVAATSPGEVSARRDIESGVLPLNVQGAEDLFRGTGPDGAGLKGLQEQSIEFAKLRGQDKKQVLLQLLKDRLKAIDLEKLPKEVQLERPVSSLLPSRANKGTGRTGRTGSDPAVETRRRAAQQLKESERIKTSLDGQFLVLTEIDEREKIRIASMFELSAINKKYNDLTAAALSNEEKINLENARGLELGVARIEQAKALEAVQQAELAAQADSLAKFLSDFDAAFQELDAKAKAQADKMDALYASIGQTISTSIVDSLTAAVDGTKRLSDVASDTLRSLANILLKFGLNSLLGGLAGNDGVGVFSKLFGGGRAKGGTVMGGTSYMVGERGPELFTPGRSGSIAPNSSMGGGANVVVNVDASGTKAEGDGRQANQLGAALGAAVQAELIKQKRPGGLLAA